MSRELTQKTKDQLIEMGVRAKRSLGQNFLVSETVIAKIIAVVQATHADTYIEIGPGMGALTEPLLNMGIKPVLIELDRELATHWRRRGFQVIEDDALKYRWDGPELDKTCCLVSNLPYQISTHLVVDRCFGPEQLKYMVLMFQKEVAQRLMAPINTKQYGLLSVMCQVFWRMQRVVDAAPRDFHPAPKVASRVLSFERRSGVNLGSEFLEFVKAAFAYRRKFVIKNWLSAKKVGVDENKLSLIMNDLGLDKKVRAEQLTPEQYVQIFQGLQMKPRS